MKAVFSSDDELVEVCKIGCLCAVLLDTCSVVFPGADSPEACSAAISSDDSPASWLVVNFGADVASCGGKFVEDSINR